MSVLECPKPTPGHTDVPVRYSLADRLVVDRPVGSETRLDVWVPLIPDTPYQRVLAQTISTDAEWSVAREPRFGNQMAHIRPTGESAGALDVEVRYELERLPVAHTLHPACARPLTTPALHRHHLASERFVDVTEETRALAATVVGDEANPLSQARRLFEHVTGTMRYDTTQQSGTGSTQHALTCSVGNCNDIHALFISLARSAGIPARLILGQALEPTIPGEEDCDVCGYHCWAEFFATGLGWVPVDASCTCKYGTDGLFGTLEMNHVAWSVGRDIELAPPQHGPPLLFFAGPYAELDGEPLATVTRHLTVATG
jgi:transglutaminase-like putative cysteine protease